MARDIGQRFNHLFGGGEPLFVLPQAVIDESVAVLPGLDGRKMSKSYDNTIPLFEGGSKALRDAIARIVTDSRAPGEPKDAEGSALVALHDAFAANDEREAFRADLAAGLAWGEAKQRLFVAIEREIGPMRERYAELVTRPDLIEDALQAGAAKARAVAGPFLATLRDAVGLRRSHALRPGAEPAEQTVVALAQPSFKQYREPDGRFFFKLVDADDALLLQSRAFAEPREAGRWVARLRSEGANALAEAPVTLVADERTVREALDRLAAASE
jgi:tryptophanyl-tRNA synthetase